VPAVTVALPVELERLKSDPAPLSPTLWGLPVPLSLIVRAPLRAPVAVGAKVTLIAHADPADRLVGQLLVCE
jgi:hypothetical protein